MATDAPAVVRTDPPTAPTAPARPRRRWPVVLGCALLALALVAWATWSGVSSAAVGGVRVTYDAQPLACEGSELGTMPDAANPAFLQPAVALTPGMRCELKIQVVNDGRSDVTVTDVALLGLGNGNPLGIEAVLVNPNGQLRIPNDRGAAIFEIEGGITVPAGTTATFTAVLDYDGGAEMVECSAQGMNIPAVTVTSLGATREVQPPAEDMLWFHAGSFESCP